MLHVFIQLYLYLLVLPKFELSKKKKRKETIQMKSKIGNYFRLFFVTPIFHYMKKSNRKVFVFKGKTNSVR